MVQVNLNFAEPAPAERGDGVDVGGVVFVDREEESVPRRAAVGVAEFFEQAWVFADPAFDSAGGAGGVDLAVLRLVMVGNTKDYVHRLVARRTAAGVCGHDVLGQPPVEPAPAHPPCRDRSANRRNHQK